MKCELCTETIPDGEEMTCTCGKKTCEECGRTTTKQVQSGSVMNAVTEIWECNACEFGPE